MKSVFNTFIKIVILGAAPFMANAKVNEHGFTYLDQVCPQIIIHMSYATSENFTGEVVEGYKARKALMAEAPAQALCKVQLEALKRGYSLKVFDAYRPVRAVSFFQEWAKLPENDSHRKEVYYPHFSRMDLFEKGFIAKRSSHSRGSAVDLTLVDLSSGKDFDMGTEFDYFHEKSHTESPLVNKAQLANRLLLKELMESFGFRNFHQEWWHYSFRPEPYPEQYFDFDVE